MLSKWTKFPHHEPAYEFDAAGLERAWPRLHRGDCEPFPQHAAVIDAWRAFHAGRFAEAVATGRGAGGAGEHAAIKAQVVYAEYLERRGTTRQSLLQEAAAWAQRRGDAAHEDANAHYLHAFALRQQRRGLIGNDALAQTLDRTIKDELLHALTLERRHADAHAAYGGHQAEVIERLGSTLARATYGARRASAIDHLDKSLALHADSAEARIEYANALLLLFGRARLDDANRLYEQAAAQRAADAAERLAVERAKAELE